MGTNRIITRVIEENRFFLMEHESKDLISEYGIPVGKYKLTHDIEEAIKFANNIGYPVVIKVMSPDIIHKTEANIIKLNINSDDELKDAYKEILKNAEHYNAKAEVKGINVQKMAIDGVLEIIIGGIKDVNFGPVLMFGLGGIFVEIFKDISYRVCPITQAEAERMINSIKAYPLLDGYRGNAKGDIIAIIGCLQSCCRLLIENPEIKELDLNPVIVFEKGKGIIVVDARIILEEVEENEQI